MEPASHALLPQFDRILSRIEVGQIDQGIIHLVGLLDGVLIDCDDPEQVRLSLLAHPLGTALRQPAMAQSTNRLGIAGALAARSELAQSTLAQARQRGERCLVLDDDPASAPCGPFDLILAAHLPDRFAGEGLDPAIHAAAGILAPGGRLALSFFVPGHLGCGWQTLWLGQPIARHAPEAVGAAARAAGLEPRMFHDASDSLVWAELRKGAAVSSTGEQA